MAIKERTPIGMKSMVCSVVDTYKGLDDCNINVFSQRYLLEVKLGSSVVIKLTKQEVEEIATYWEKL
jgi:hypothetical protein